MAIDTGSLYYLFDPAFQIENNNGKPVVGGHVEVFEAGTDTKVITYEDWDGTRNPFKIPLKSDGRAVILVEIGKRYDAYAYDSFNNLVFSRLNILPLTEASINGLTQVYHDGSLNGNGTINSPLSVANQGGLSYVETSWPVEGDGTSNDPVTVKDLTVLANDETLTAYNSTIEGNPALVLGVNEAWLDKKLSDFGGFEVVEGDEEGKPIVENPKPSVIYLVQKEEGEGYNEWIYNNNEWIYIGSTSIDLSDYAKKEDLEGFMEESKLAYDTVNNEIVSYNGIPFAGRNNECNLFIAEYGVTSYDDIKAAIDDGKVVIARNGRIEYTISSNVSEIWSTDAVYFNAILNQAQAGFPEQSLIVCRKLPEGNTEWLVLRSGYQYSLVSKEDISDMATKTWVNDQGFLKEHQSLDGYATESWVENKNYATENFVTNITNNKLDISVFRSASGDFALKTEIPSLDGYATESWVEGKGYITNADIPTVAAGANIKVNYDSVNKKYTVSGKDWSSEIPSLDGYATEQWVNDQGFLKEHQSLDGYATEQWVENKNYATENFVTNITNNKLDISVFRSASGDFALKTEIPSLDGYATEQWVNDQGFLKEHQSLDGYMEESKLGYDDDGKIKSYDGVEFAGTDGKVYTGIDPVVVDNDNDTISVNHKPLVAGNNITIVDETDSVTIHADTPSLAGYATEQWVNEQGFAKETDIPSLDGYMQEAKLAFDTVNNEIISYNGIPFAGSNSSYTSPNETVLVDNDSRTLEATKYAMVYKEQPVSTNTATLNVAPNFIRLGMISSTSDYEDILVDYSLTTNNISQTLITYQLDLRTGKTYTGRIDNGKSLTGSVRMSEIESHLKDGNGTLQIFGYKNSSSVTASATVTLSSLGLAKTELQEKLTAGANITIDENNVISSTGGGGGQTYVAGEGINISDANVISVKLTYKEV